MICPNCETNCAAGAAFCGSCGTRLAHDGSTARAGTAVATSAAIKEEVVHRAAATRQQPSLATGGLEPVTILAACAGLGFIGCFFSTTAVGAANLSIMKLAGDLSAVLYLIPALFLFMTGVAYLLWRQSVRPRSAWLASVAAAAGLVTGFTLVAWAALGAISGFGDLAKPALGMYLPTLSAIVSLGLAIRESFREASLG